MILDYNSKKMFYQFYNKNKTQTVAFLHGWGGNHLSLTKLFNSFDNYNILTLDFFGFGQSDKPTKDFDVYTYADAVLKLINFLNLTNVSIVGHSFGGRIAIILASKQVNLINKIILIDSAGVRPRKSLIKSTKIMKYKFNKFLVKHKMRDKKVLDKYGSSDYKCLDDEQKIVFNKIINEDLTCYLNKITCDTLIIWGSNDKDTPLYMAKKINRNIKNSQLFVIKNATHFCYLEQTKVVNKIIKEFLS